MCTGRWLGREGSYGAEERTNQNPYGSLIASFPTLMIRVFFTRSWCSFVMELNTHLDGEPRAWDAVGSGGAEGWLFLPSSQEPGGQSQQAWAFPRTNLLSCRASLLLPCLGLNWSREEKVDSGKCSSNLANWTLPLLPGMFMKEMSKQMQETMLLQDICTFLTCRVCTKYFPTMFSKPENGCCFIISPHQLYDIITIFLTITKMKQEKHKPLSSVRSLGGKQQLENNV